ncbi:MAG TPA: cytochrome c3 family protein [Bryobacteraceae bacterium]|nr:cytochrome c3 family protein [Bryobacteraceae bacterium]
MTLRLLLSLMLAGLMAAQKEPKPPVGATPAQPLPFSHQLHSGVGLKCLECHQTAATASAAGMPSVDLCMRCHIAVKKDSTAIAALARHHKEKKPIEWVSLYRLPDFVYFSHRRHHAKARIECVACHGDVSTQPVLSKVKSIAMSSCQACHDARKANNSCDACHVPHPAD